MTEINGADTAWVLVSCALVLLMTPGLALFYGGMVNSRNVLSTFMHSFIALGVMTIQWVVIGYSISFAPVLRLHRRPHQSAWPAAPRRFRGACSQ